MKKRSDSQSSVEDQMNESSAKQKVSLSNQIENSHSDEDESIESIKKLKNFSSESSSEFIKKIDSLCSSDSEDESLASLKKNSNDRNKISNNVSTSSCNSEDEPLFLKTSRKRKQSSSCSRKKLENNDEENYFENQKKSIALYKSPEKCTKDSPIRSDSENESLLEERTENKLRARKKHNSESSDDEDENFIKKSVTYQKKSSKKRKVVLSDSSDSDNETLAFKESKPFDDNIDKVSRKLQSNHKQSSFSSEARSDPNFLDEDVPKLKCNSLKKSNAIDSSTDNSDCDSLEDWKKCDNSKPEDPVQRSSDVCASLDDGKENESSQKQKPVGKEKKSKSSKNVAASEKKIEKLKKFLRTAGIHVQSYAKLFEKCKTLKSKVEKVLEILHMKGLKGKPTLEKCKKLKYKIETQKEFSELDASNIISSEGRSRRGVNFNSSNEKFIDNSPHKRFSRLKEIIDSEESS